MVIFSSNQKQTQESISLESLDGLVENRSVNTHDFWWNNIDMSQVMSHETQSVFDIGSSPQPIDDV